MQAAELQAHHQNHGFRTRFAELLGHAHGRECGVATHESEVVTLDRVRQTQSPDNLQIGTGIAEPGAGYGDDMGDVFRLKTGCMFQSTARNLDGKRPSPMGIESVSRLGRGFRPGGH